MLKSPLAASSTEEWYLQKLTVSGIPFRDGGSSDNTLEHISYVLVLKTRTAKQK